jgi:uncharacterized SAM-binding protein YcdF (DUF218 family)
MIGKKKLALLLKFIVLPFYPFGLSLILIIAGLITLYFQKKSAGSILIIIGLAVICFFSIPVTANLLCKSLELKYGQDKITEPVSAIVVLGGGGMPLCPPRKYPEVNDAGDRLIHCARLYKSGICKRVITTGSGVGWFKDIPSEGYENALLLREFGVDSSSIIIESKARNTHEHPRNIALILDSLHLPKTIVLVTSASHMKRSVAVFRKAGYKVFSATADYQSLLNTFNTVMDFFPNPGSLELSTRIIHEYYGILGYKLLGWI